MKKNGTILLLAGTLALVGLTGCNVDDGAKKTDKTEQKTEEKKLSKKKETNKKEDKEKNKEDNVAIASPKTEVSEKKVSKESNDTQKPTSKPKPDERPRPENKPKPESKPSKPDTKPEVKPNKPDSKPKPQHEHKWKEKFKTVHHDAVTKTETIHHEAEGHTEKVMVVPARDEKLMVTHWICNQCGADITDNPVGHILNSDTCGGYHSESKWDGGYVHYDPVYEERWVETKPVWDETKEVVVKPAWDEKVSEGFYCTECGKKKD